MRLCLLRSVLLGIFLSPLMGHLRAGELSDLRVSENGHFLVRRDGAGFFPVADTAWGIAWKLDRDQVEKYLQRRKEQKFNTIALVAFPSYEYRKTPANVYGDQPFEIDNGKYNPLKPVVTTGKHPADSNEYDYWDHLEYIVDASAAKGMYVVLLPAWGGCVAGGYGNGKDTSGIILRLPEAYPYGNWIGKRFKEKENILWMLGGDRSAVYGEKDYRKVFAAIAEGIADGTNEKNLFDGKADFSKTLISYHPQKWAPNSSEWFHNNQWLAFNSIQDQPKDQIASTEFDFNLTPAKPTWLFEGGYEHRGNNTYQDWQIRFQSYQTVFAGGFGITYGNMNIYHFGGNWESCLDDPGARQMQHLLDLMTSLSREQYLDRIPDQSLIEGDQGEMHGAEGDRSKRIQATRGRMGDYALVYAASGRNIRVKMEHLVSPTMNAFWFNPRNGKWHIKGKETTSRTPFASNIPSGEHSPVREFDPPGKEEDENDWVLVLSRTQERKK